VCSSDLYSTEMLATRVLPKLRPLWSEYEDHWSPKPMPRDDRAVPRAVTAGRGSSPATTHPVAAEAREVRS
jgi:hypothetical protein